ncbi:hypothetical protein OSTOST_16124 [Ostertagia ostertagi]
MADHESDHFKADSFDGDNESVNNDQDHFHLEDNEDDEPYQPNNDDGHNNDEANRQQPDVAEELNALQSAISRISRKVSTNQVYLREIEHRISQLERATQRLTETMQRWEDQQQPRQQQQQPAPHADQNRRRRNSPPSLDNRRNQATTTCAFCGDEHWATDCTQYRTLSQRRAQCYNRNRCERCLREATHMVTSCNVNLQCFYCRRDRRTNVMSRHNSAFCPYQFPM